MHRHKITFPPLFAALKNVDTDICFDRTEKDFCFSRRGNALDSYYQTEQACGTDRVTYVTKQDLLCAAKTKPGMCN